MTAGIIAILVVALLLVDVPLFFWWRERQRDRERERLLPARGRAAALVHRALDAYRSAQVAEVHLQRQDLWSRALMAASGKSEAEARTYVARAMQRPEPEAALQVLLVQAAEKQERDLVIESSPGLLMNNIAEARETVVRLVPREM